ncbi:MAG: hydrogenase maturation nickel metallochaperone HypA [Deltaproteobacteria bacterium]|nr:hydrogenase maturation nickel metallochaperone HypA [Deltaproteobacteria bacterium]
MHELSIAVDLIATIEDTARAHQATGVSLAIVEVGALSGVVPDALSFAFEVARKGSLAADCTLEIKEVPLKARCSACQWEGEIEPLNPVCPSCKELSMEVLSGRDMRLVSIEIDEEKDHA